MSLLDVRNVLSASTVYNFFRTLTGSEKLNRVFIDEYVRPVDGMSILDVGCGPAEVVKLLPQCEYLGVDMSSNYIEAAKTKYGGRAKFICDSISNLPQLGFKEFDRIICMGVFHHLNDENVRKTLEECKNLLKPGGTFVSYDPCFIDLQNPVAKLIHSLDRGEHVRHEKDLWQIAREVLGNFHSEIRTDLCSVPSTVQIISYQRTQ